MNRLPRNAILGAAIVMGLVAAFLAYSYMSKPSVETAGTAQIVTAKASITAGAILTSDMLQMRNLDVANIPPDTVTDIQEAVGKVVVQDIKSGEPVTAGSLSEKSRLSQRIPKLMRGVTVAIDPIIGVGGYLEPGDRVDVAATYSSNDGTMTKIVLQNVQLIAIGSEVVEEKQASADENAKTVPKTQTNATLAVMPSEAEKLILAEAKGKLRLVLRRSDDTTYTQTKGMSSRALFGIIPSDVAPKGMDLPPLPPRPRPAPSPLVPPLPAPLAFGRYEIKPRPSAETQTPPKKTIEIIRGTKVEQTTVDR